MSKIVKSHRYDINNVCIKCGVTRMKKPIVGKGFNPMLVGKYSILYSKDGVNFQKEHIECKNI
jgi:hypothetical protein